MTITQTAANEWTTKVRGNSFTIQLQALTVPRYKRKQLLQMAPGVTTDMLTGWTKRGFFTRGFAWGDAASLMKENEARTVRLYSGGDLIAVMVLELLSRSPLPLSIGDQVIGQTQELAMHRLLGREERMVLVVDEAGAVRRMRRAGLGEHDENEFFAVIDISKVVDRFIQAID